MKCCIVIDLLPGYIDGLTSEETNEEIEKHLESCTSCRTIYRQMNAGIPNEMPAKIKSEYAPEICDRRTFHLRRAHRDYRFP